jgi:predicted membrane metal-binding protein
MPYILYLFGNYSLLALLANFIVMPIIPILMLVGFVAALAGIFIPNYAYLLGQPINWAVAELFKFLAYLQLQRDFVVNAKPQVTTLIIWYLCLSLLGIIVYHRRLARRTFTFQTPDQLIK